MRMPPNILVQLLNFVAHHNHDFISATGTLPEDTLGLKVRKAIKKVEHSFFPFQITILIFIQIEFSTCLHFECCSFSLYPYFCH